ncbi:hypothetical protein OK074_1049 [Actinobacteria bacterium OK074]|nr:hypothetical protein OK074_1049 [Actinobacteria bacterium OK074]
MERQLPVYGRRVTEIRGTLAVHDHGGDGPPLVLLHGARSTLAAWSGVAPLLVDRHRVLAVDLRGHGRSPSGTWDFPRVLGDIEDVLDAHGIPDALPVGHSLGGMIAVRYALAHPDVTPGAVNLDGYGWGRPDQYVGLDPAAVAEHLATLWEMGTAPSPALSAEDFLDLLAEQRAACARQGIPYDAVETGLFRSLREQPDGRQELGPDARLVREMTASVRTLDLFELFRRTTTPLLLARALRPMPSIPGNDWYDGLMAAYARGLDRDLAELAAERPNVTVVHIDATHNMVLDNPRAVAAAILRFAAEGLVDVEGSAAEGSTTAEGSAVIARPATCEESAAAVVPATPVDRDTPAELGP